MPTIQFTQYFNAENMKKNKLNNLKKFQTMKTLIANHKKIWIAFLPLLFLIFNNSVFAQTPVPMSAQPGLTYTENFADIANWTNNFASGIGASRWGSVAINATGTIPDGVRTTVSTATFTTTTSGGVQKGTGNIIQLKDLLFLIFHP